MCMVSDDAYWEFSSSKHPKARKDHACGECGRTITKGETYWFFVGSYDGSFSTHKTCEHCDIASAWLVEACGGWVFNARQEDLGEHVDGEESYLNSPALEELYGWMKADWRDDAGDLRTPAAVKTLTDEAVLAYRTHMAEIAATAKAD